MISTQPGTTKRTCEPDTSLQVLDGYNASVKVYVFHLKGQGLRYATTQTEEKPDEQSVSKAGGCPFELFNLVKF
jgi:hypothetical protein